MNFLSDVITYVRRLIKTPSNAQVTDELIIDYINRFWIMDVDARMQLFDLKTKYAFQTSPGVDQYNMPLYNLQTEQGSQSIGMYPVYQGFLSPAYINGVQVPLQTQKNSFFSIWPNVVQNLQAVATGDGGATYTFTVPILPNSTSPQNPPLQGLLRGHVDISGIIATGQNQDPPFGTTINTLIPSTSIAPAVYITTLDANGNSVVVTDSGQFLNDFGTLLPNYGLLMSPGNAPFGYSALPGGYSTIVTITGVTQATQAVVTAANAFQAGQIVHITGIVGMTELNGLPFTVVSANSTSFTIDVDSTGFTPYVSGGNATSLNNVINYMTGEVTVTFPVAIPSGQNISIQCYYFQTGLPRAILYYNNTLTLRSPPDKQYLVEIDAYLSPAAFLTSAAALPFAYMAEYIARGAARKILSDTGDIEQFQFYEPLFREQELLVWKRSQRQWTNNRTETIYSQGFAQGLGNNSYGGGTL